MKYRGGVLGVPVGEAEIGIVQPQPQERRGLHWDSGHNCGADPGIIPTIRDPSMSSSLRAVPARLAWAAALALTVMRRVPPDADRAGDRHREQRPHDRDAEAQQNFGRPT